MIYFLYESILFLSFGQCIAKDGTVMNTCMSQKFYTNLLHIWNQETRAQIATEKPMYRMGHKCGLCLFDGIRQLCHLVVLSGLAATISCDGGDGV